MRTVRIVRVVLSCQFRTGSDNAERTLSPASGVSSGVSRFFDSLRFLAASCKRPVALGSTKRRPLRVAAFECTNLERLRRPVLYPTELTGAFAQCINAFTTRERPCTHKRPTSALCSRMARCFWLRNHPSSAESVIDEVPPATAD
jgi:hypothetical protein